MPTTTALAWIYTFEADHYDPEVTITGQLDDEGSAPVVEQYKLGAYATLADGRLRLATEGWRVVGEAQELETGRYTVDVERI